jgi:hypothetical protein
MAWVVFINTAVSRMLNTTHRSYLVTLRHQSSVTAVSSQPECENRDGSPPLSNIVKSAHVRFSKQELIVAS